jgi:hypothetical protein
MRLKNANIKLLEVFENFVLVHGCQIPNYVIIMTFDPSNLGVLAAIL